MKLHLTERANAAAESLLFANFPRDKQRKMVVCERRVFWRVEIMQVTVEHVEAEETHLGTDDPEPNYVLLARGRSMIVGPTIRTLVYFTTASAATHAVLAVLARVPPIHSAAVSHGHFFLFSPATCLLKLFDLQIY